MMKYRFKPYKFNESDIFKDIGEEYPIIDKERYSKGYVLIGKNNDTGNTTFYQIEGKIFPEVDILFVMNNINDSDIENIKKSIKGNIDVEIKEKWSLKS